MLNAYDEFVTYKALKLGGGLSPARAPRLVEVLEGLQAKEQRRREEEWRAHSARRAAWLHADRAARHAAARGRRTAGAGLY